MNPFPWLLSLSLFPIFLFGQGVVISNQTTTPHSSAGLEVNFNDRGLLMPRLTTTQRNAIASPAVGLQIYNSSVHCVQVYFPGGWNNVSCDCTNPPPAPSTISGPANICPGDTALQFSIASVLGAVDYTWSVPQGWQISSGQDSLLMTANSDTSTGNKIITVSANNGCGSSAPTSFTVNSVFVNPSIVVPNAIYLNSPAIFSSQQTGGTYQWSFASGNPATSSSASPSVTWSQAAEISERPSITSEAAIKAEADAKAAEAAARNAETNVALKQRRPSLISDGNGGYIEMLPKVSLEQ